MYKSKVAAILGAGVMAATAFGEEVGDKMPSVEGMKMVNYQPWNDGENMGLIAHLHENGVCKYNIIMDACNGELRDKPYAIYDIQNNTIYLDNNPIDGIVDEVIPDAREKRINIFKKTPRCIGNNDV